jgi:hypothetical protein
MLGVISPHWNTTTHAWATGYFALISQAGETVNALIPHPLPRTPAIAWVASQQALSQRAMLAAGRLDGLHITPAPSDGDDRLVRAFLRQSGN